MLTHPYFEETLAGGDKFASVCAARTPVNCERRGRSMSGRGALATLPPHLMFDWKSVVDTIGSCWMNLR
jgi:hypothetical protein